LRKRCSWRLTLSRAARTNTPSCSCEMCTSEPKSIRARRAGAPGEPAAAAAPTPPSAHSASAASRDRATIRMSEAMAFYDDLALLIISIPQKNPHAYRY
jgi:hypothetical protein